MHKKAESPAEAARSADKLGLGGLKHDALEKGMATHSSFPA